MQASTFRPIRRVSHIFSSDVDTFDRYNAQFTHAVNAFHRTENATEKLQQLATMRALVDAQWFYTLNAGLKMMTVDHNSMDAYKLQLFDFYEYDEMRVRATSNRQLVADLEARIGVGA